MPWAANDRISTDPIDGGTEISQEQYSAALAGVAAGKLITIDDGFAMLDPPEPEPAPKQEALTLAELKATLCYRVDANAEATRLKYITGGAGQAMTYQQKAAEAASCLEATDPQAADYPLLAAEIGITAATLSGVAQVVYDAHQQWRVIGAEIEALRLGAKAAVNAAATVEDAEAAAVVAWPLSAQ